MTILLGKVFGKSLSESSAEESINTVAAVSIGRWLDVRDETLSAAVTEMLGCAIAKKIDQAFIE